MTNIKGYSTKRDPQTINKKIQQDVLARYTLDNTNIQLLMTI
jgi:hypothetical protein